jgi:hypothetical protein
MYSLLLPPPRARAQDSLEVYSRFLILRIPNFIILYDNVRAVSFNQPSGQTLLITDCPTLVPNSFIHFVFWEKMAFELARGWSQRDRRATTEPDKSWVYRVVRNAYANHNRC